MFAYINIVNNGYRYGVYICKLTKENSLFTNVFTKVNRFVRCVLNCKQLLFGSEQER